MKTALYFALIIMYLRKATNLPSKFLNEMRANIVKRCDDSHHRTNVKSHNLLESSRVQR